MRRTPLSDLPASSTTRPHPHRDKGRRRGDLPGPRRRPSIYQLINLQSGKPVAEVGAGFTRRLESSGAAFAPSLIQGNPSKLHPPSRRFISIPAPSFLQISLIFFTKSPVFPFQNPAFSCQFLSFPYLFHPFSIVFPRWFVFLFFFNRGFFSVSFRSGSVTSSSPTRIN